MSTPIHAKQYRLHRDDGAYHPDPQALEEVWKFAQEIPAAAEGSPPRLEPRMKVARPYNRTIAKWNNPIALWYVVDRMVTARRGAYIRSPYMADELARTVPHYHWRPASVGRMMGGLYDCQAEHYDRALGNDKFPIGRGRDARGMYYVIDPYGGIEGALWLIKVRDHLVPIVEQIMYAEQNGDFEHSMWSDGQAGFAGPSEYYFTNLPGPVRSTEHFLASLEPDRLYGARVQSGRKPLQAAF